uniref:Uncharacterized protein n=1 Tax=Parascaris equorum TaxID=6256 RepID=A0A914SFJ4_PAREQ
MTSRVDRFSDIKDYFLSKGYSDGEIYGTTYGDAGRTSMLSGDKYPIVVIGA